jgi:hypothetical protein
LPSTRPFKYIENAGDPYSLGFSIGIFDVKRRLDSVNMVYNGAKTRGKTTFMKSVSQPRSSE